MQTTRFSNGDKVYYHNQKASIVKTVWNYYENDNKNDSYLIQLEENNETFWCKDKDLHTVPIKYTMSFTDVINEIFNTKGWYQGEDFENGVFITVENNVLVAKSFNEKSSQWKFDITFGVVNMKYRRMYNQTDVERRL